MERVVALVSRILPWLWDEGSDSDVEDFSDGGHADAVGPVQGALYKLWNKRLQDQLLEKTQLYDTTNVKLQGSEQLCVTLKESIEEQKAKLEKLEASVEEYQKGMDNESFLFQESGIFRNVVASNRALEDEHELMEELKAQNKDLQTTITVMRYGQPGINDDQYYREKFNELFRKINMCAGKFNPARDAVTRELFTTFIQAVATLGPSGQKTANSLKRLKKEKAYGLFCDNRVRRILYAHLIALYIYDGILKLFAFGMEPSLSKALNQIEATILTTEREFGKVLTIRQSLGIASIEMAQKNHHDYRQRLINHFAHLVNPLLPQSPSKSRGQDIVKIIDLGISLRNDMTKEHAIYFCYWFAADDKVRSDSTRYVFDGTVEDGVVPLCIQPGFGRRINENDSLDEIVLMPAEVKLE